MNGDVFSLWVYLARTPLLWLTVTILIYCGSDRISAGLRRHPLANPVLLSVCLIGVLVLVTHIPYATYFEGAQFIHFLLRPATVALGIPLYQNRYLVIRSILPLTCALFAGSFTALGSTILIARCCCSAMTIGVEHAGRTTTSACGDAWAM